MAQSDQVVYGFVVTLPPATISVGGSHSAVFGRSARITDLLGQIEGTGSEPAKQ
jgi:hypothetical protein